MTVKNIQSQDADAYKDTKIAKKFIQGDVEDDLGHDGVGGYGG